MSWRDVDKDATHTFWRCFICKRQAVSTGAKPSPCVCSPGVRPRKRNTTGLKR